MISNINPSAPPPPPPPSDLSVANLPPVSEGRTNLLADIRKGMKLKSAKSRKLSTKTPTKKTPSSGKKAAAPPAPAVHLFS